MPQEGERLVREGVHSVRKTITRRILEALESGIRMKNEFLRKHPYIEETHIAGLTPCGRKTIYRGKL